MGWPWPGVDPPHAGGFDASCRAGLRGGGGGCRSLHSGLSVGPSTKPGRRVSGVRTGLTQLGLRDEQGPAWRSNQREKKSLTGQMCVL